ncbi:MAG: hypothetical protein KC613_08110 [Myxococcales bacterium]|nr:hypothetical protein [Myxococcales bacterium]
MASPVPDLPEALWARVKTHQADPDALPGPDVAAELIAWCEGRHPNDLQALLDALRAEGAYAVSLEVLEEAWNAELPLTVLGRVAEDWIGTVLHGVGDRAGASVVATHLVPRAKALGAAFAGDLGHLCLEWRLYAAADPLVRFAAADHPGDTALQYALGVVTKLAGEWDKSRDAFRAVLAQRPDEHGALWSLGIACTALEDWVGARDAWGRLGLTLPPGDGDFAAAGDATPVRLPTAGAPDAPVPFEVVWGVRLCPARARLVGIPRFSLLAAHGDVVLLDGEATGETQGPDGQPRAILPALDRWGPPAARPRFVMRGPLEDPRDRGRLQQALGELARAGFPVADWTGLDGAPDRLMAALVLPSDRAPAEAEAAAQDALGALPLFWPELRRAAGLDATAHHAALADEGIP